MAVLLTGATGFIGSRVLARLVAQEERVRVLVRPATLARADVASDLAKHKGVEVVAADLTDETLVARAAQGVDVVFHLAWQWKRSGNTGAESASFEADPGSAQAIERNLNAVNHLLAASSAQGVRRFVFTSSVAVYGPPAMIRQFPITEDTDVILGEYGSSPFVKYYMAPKIAIEHMIRSYSKCGLEYVILRPSVVYGPRAPFAERLVQKTLAAARWTSPEAASGKWQMVHVDDVAQAVVLAGTVPEAKNLEFNIAGAEVATEEDIKKMIWAAASAEWSDAEPASQGPARFKSYQFPRYDISRAGRVLKYVPQVPLHEGLRELVATVLSLPDKSRTADRVIAAGAPVTSPQPVPDSGAAAARLTETFDIREFYDERVESDFLTDYFEHSGFWNFGYRVTGAETPREACEKLMERLLAMIGEARGTILDVACGNGATTAHLTKHFAPERITAINFSSRQITRAVERAPGCRFVLMDATALAFPDNSFDYLICVEAAFHFARDAFLREAVRVLKSRGRLVLADAVLPPASHTQPRANYVSGTEEYRTRCLASGFSAVEVTDATNQCWAAFSADLAHYTRRRLREGEVTLRRFYEVMLWLRHLGPERYLLTSCLK